MVVQANMAAAVTDRELQAEQRRLQQSKQDLNPIKTLTSIAAVAGGQFILVSGIRLILTICLLVASATLFYALLEYADFTIPVCLAIVVGANLAVALVLAIIVVTSRKSSNGLGDLFKRGSKNAEARTLPASCTTLAATLCCTSGELACTHSGKRSMLRSDALVKPSLGLLASAQARSVEMMYSAGLL